MKKLLILIMSCNQDFFQNEEKLLEQTYLQKIKQYDNIDYCIYSGDENIDNHIYNKYTKRLYLRCEDDVEHTYKKTYYALSYIKEHFPEYDYIFRTNTSTYINIDLLNYFIHHIDYDDKTVWSGEIYSLNSSVEPYPCDILMRGNALLIPNNIINIILKEGFRYLYLNMIDDRALSLIINSHWIENGENYCDYIKSFSHGWYKVLFPTVKDDNAQSNNSHKLCQWKNSRNDWDFIKNFITLQIKSYIDRTYEEKYILELYDAYSSHTYTEEELKNSYDFIINYSKNPSVFLGSIIGYISYDKWKNIDKNKLFNFEANNKAYDDPDKGKFNKWL